MLLVVTEGGLAVVAADWGMDDVVLRTCGPAELEARIRLAIGRLPPQRDADDPESHVIRSGEVVVDDATYTAKLGGRPLDLTFKEFELLKYLAQHPGRVFTREQLLQEVWGYDYFGGTRTVDVHVRRLRAKLGPENETLIGTVRNVGYRFVLPPQRARPRAPGHPRVASARRRRGRLLGSRALGGTHRSRSGAAADIDRIGAGGSAAASTYAAGVLEVRQPEQQDQTGRATAPRSTAHCIGPPPPDDLG